MDPRENPCPTGRATSRVARDERFRRRRRAAAAVAAGWLAAATALAQSPAAGVFLVAGPDLRDPNFARTVVLIIEHGDNGTLGLIVNRPTESKLSDLLSDFEGLGERSDTLFEGGPVGLDRLRRACHRRAQPGFSSEFRLPFLGTIPACDWLR